jgi:hypothetical protein
VPRRLHVAGAGRIATLGQDLVERSRLGAHAATGGTCALSQ